MDTNLRPKTREPLLRQETTEDGNSTRRPIPHTSGRLRVQFRFKGHVLQRIWNRPILSEVVYGERVRPTLPLGRPTDGVAALTFPVLPPHGDLHAPPPTTDPTCSPLMAKRQGTTYGENVGYRAAKILRRRLYFFASL
jgi:hypothetical protein